MPVKKFTLKLFYPNFKDYYYLPIEDTCILKSIASGVDKPYRENATKETCYTKVSGRFLPAPAGLNGFTVFRADYTAKDTFIALKELTNKEAFDLYSQTLLHDMLSY